MQVRSPRPSPPWGAFALSTASVSCSTLVSVLLQLVSCATFLLLAGHHASAVTLPALPQATAHDQAAVAAAPHVLTRDHPSPPLLQHGHVYSTGTINIVRCSESQRTGLLQFKAGLHLDDPNSHTRLSSWRGLDCCRGWEGVTCDSLIGSVTKLDLRDWSLSGRPPSSSSSSSSNTNKSGNLISDTTTTAAAVATVMFSPLLQLKSSLRYLDLSFNSFYRIPIPSFFGSFKELRYLNLSYSEFAGTIPPQLGNLSRLQYLDLSDDPFSSTSMFSDYPFGSTSLLRVDSLRWVSELSRLRYLSLDNVNLLSMGDTLDWVQLLNERLPHLVELHLSHCSLSSIASSLDYTNFTSLKVLDLSDNLFFSSIPNWLPNISGLEYVDLRWNDLRGPIPIIGFSQLRHLDLSYNRNLNANISELLGRQGDWQRINTLRMFWTNLSGEIPPSIGNITSLAQLALSGNCVRGVIPSSIGELRQLTELYLRGNSIVGELPPTIWRLPKLAHLDVASNQLSGTVTDAHLSSLGAKLKMLGLGGGNHLIVNLSPHWIPPFQLNHLSMASCQLGPAFPSWIKSQRELKSIDLRQNGILDELPKAWFWDLPSRHNLELILLSENNLTGSIPMYIGELQNLVYLDLSSNLLTGVIPTSIGGLQYLDLSNNNLVGGIPTSIGEIGGLQFLILSNNKLVGDIPASIGKIGGLWKLDLSNNNLVGNIPASIGEIGDLRYLELSNNKLVGGIPTTLGKLYYVSSLDFSGNNLSGSIPTTLLNSSSLRLLNLGGNNFSGDIAMLPLGSMKDLRVLNLSGNMLSGKFPPFIRNLAGLEALDLGFNNLHGDIPSWIGEIQDLKILRMRSNMFSGEIPPQLSNLKSLQVLDLANNNLTGRIPEQLGGLNSMLNATQLHSLSKGFIGHAREISMHKKGSNLKFVTEGLVCGIMIHMKGLNLEFATDRGLPITSIDLSDNKLSGRFPENLTNLAGLVALNLSSNSLRGTIPEMIGNMHELESLDLSSNHFTGRLLPSMSSMSFLSFLNLSYNNFSGEIPAGGQLDTFGNASFFGNPYLCGRFIERTCLRNNLKQVDVNRDEEDQETFEEEDGFYLGLGLGFAFGLLAPFLIVAIKRGWSEAYFRVVDGIIDRLLWTRRCRC